MLAERPADAGPSRDARAPAHGYNEPRRFDLMRAKALAARIAKGEDEFEAWGRICRDRRFGFTRWRGAKSVPAHQVARSLGRFYARMGMFEADLAVGRIKRRAASYAAEAFDTVTQIARGDFGTTLMLDDDGKVQKVPADARSASVRLAATRQALEVVGAVAARGAPASATAVAQAGAQASAQADAHVSLGAALRSLRHVDVEREAAEPPAA